MCKNLITVDNLTVRRGTFLLDQINFSVRENEIMAILGKTGSGKTLLLETIAGFNKPQSGAVTFSGEKVHQIPVYKRNIGYLHQDYSLFPHMTAGANIGYSLKLQKKPKSEIKARVEAMADRFGIRNILEQYPGALSGGEQQRVALARALMMRVPLLLLDEPFSALDPVTKSDLYHILQNVCRDFSCAVLFITHDFSEATKLSDRVGVLLHGKLHGVVSADELFSAEWDDEVKQFLDIDRK